MPAPTATARPTPTATPKLIAERKIQQLPWVADGIVGDDETRAVKYLRVAAVESPEQTLRLLAMPWLQGAITADEAQTVEFLRWAAINAPDLTDQMLEFPWIHDNISTDEAQAIVAFSWAAKDAPMLTGMILEYPWIQGSITTDEARAIANLSWAAYKIPALAEKMLQKPWVQDDITRDEGIIVHNLYRIARRTDEVTQQRMTDVAIRIVDMPFLDDVTFAEARAVMSLGYLTGSRYRDSFQAIMAHPKVQDGITDQEAKVIAVLRTPARDSPELIPHLLDGLDGTGGIHLEERTIQLPLTGETLLTIVRIQDRTTASMDYLEYSVRFAERFMNTALPTNYVALYFGTLGPRFGANNEWTHMAMRQTSDGLEEYARVIAHEVGHYYTRTPGPTWLTEGSTYIFNIVAEYERTGYPLETHIKNRRCDSSVKTLPASEPDEHNGCARNLGERFFLDLYRTLGEDDFLQGFRALYRLRLGDNPHCDDTRECADWNIHHVVEAFTTNVPADVAAKAKKVLLKWYGPLPTPPQ